MIIEQEWERSKAKVTAEMNEFLAQYSVPVFIDGEKEAIPHGTGTLLELDKRKWILTNEHISKVRGDETRLGCCLRDLDELPTIVGNHAERSAPWDLALLPVHERAWAEQKHTSKCMAIKQVGLAHMPVPNELLAFAGFAGSRTKTLFNNTFFSGTTFVGQEIPLPVDGRWSERFHLAVDYKPDLAKDAVGKAGLPQPNGMSGSGLWNTAYVEALQGGVTWTPELATLTGVVWGWPSSQGFILATRVEHVRAFLLEAISNSQVGTPATERE